FTFSVWDDGGMFGILDRSDNSWPEVKDILMHYHEDSPHRVFSLFEPESGTNAPAIKVTWKNRNTDNTNIFVERSVGGSSTFSQVAELPFDATEYIDTNVVAGKTYTYRMYTTRADGTLLHGYPTRVKITATEQLPFKGTAIEIPGTLEVEDYDIGGEGLAYHDSDAGNIPAGFRLDEGVDIGKHNDGFILEYVAAGEWIEYTVNVEEAGMYSVKADVASEMANGTFSITFQDNDATTNFTVPGTGNWYVFQNITAATEIQLEAGEQQIRLDITNNTPFNIDRLIFTLESSTSVNEAGFDATDFTVSPNPTTGLVNVALSDVLLQEEYHFELFSITGKKIADFSKANANTVLDLSRHPAGMYLLKLVGDQISLTRRVLIE
ncbi:MAG: carbohydrate-binding protein, partial [Bacteroidota bacterium]